MKIGIIVHSFTGNTFSVAQELKNELEKNGHSVSLNRIQVIGGEQQNMREFKLDSPPKTDEYDALIFGAPVRAFSISPVISIYLSALSSLENKKAFCYVTKHLPSNWTGGNKAVKKMKSICQSKGGNVGGTAIIFREGEERERQISQMKADLLRLFA